MIIGSKTETVPCRLCSVPTPMLGTKLCDACYELEHRVERDIALTIKILNKLGYAVVRTEEKEKTK